MSPVEAPAKELTVCLVGMPNAGKTTLMNALTGGNFRTANYPGVTVSLLRGKSKPEFGPVIMIVDLPGVHSAIAPSPEEELACSVIEGRHSRVTPDAFVLVVDATQLERHLKFAGFCGPAGKGSRRCAHDGRSAAASPSIARHQETRARARSACDSR
jgi:predicted GTPase